jgi:hypothetical protein
MVHRGFADVNTLRRVDPRRSYSLPTMMIATTCQSSGGLLGTMIVWLVGMLTIVVGCTMGSWIVRRARVISAHRDGRRHT